MNQRYNRQLDRTVCEIFAGDYYSTKDTNLVFSTLLGSCISVCLRDKTTKISGMNHFMLPSAVRGDNILFNDDARYGMQSMELLINSMMKLGATRNGLQAKVFGGGKVLGTTVTAVSDSNVQFALSYLQMEQIPILSRDVGSDVGRKIFFFPESFEVYVKKIRYNKTLETAVAREKEFMQFMNKKKEQEKAKDDNITFF
ncbi:hypothetical protein [Desulfuribacillus alkaliarsenatis]|uniref:hypothetical protein n=1 Tax=Desulfuribacillus alkaliarsenatis TaxID=766136 RepID=UPI000A04CF68|nr:hypothetical protein [Desulfuribacillus alkaliarsenatis]